MRSTVSEQMRWEEWANESRVPLRLCQQHLHLFEEVTELRKNPLSRRCFMVEKQWLDRFLAYGAELKAME